MRTASRLPRALLLWPVTAALMIVGVVTPATTAAAAPSIDQIEKQIAQESARLEKIVEQYNKINEQLKSSSAQAETLSAHVDSLRRQLDLASAEVGQLAANAYKGADMAAFSSVITSGSPEVMIDRISTLDHVASYQQQKIRSYTEAKRAKDAESARLAKTVAQQNAQRAQLEASRAKIKKDLTRLYALRKQAYGQAQRAAAAANVSATVPSSATGKAAVAVRFAQSALGKPYAWGASGPNSYDCSGLTMAAWAAAGVSLPHNAEMQWNALPHLSRNALKAGDLVFYSSLGHVAIYIGSGKVIHAPTFGEVVQVASVDMMTPYGYARPT